MNRQAMLVNNDFEMSNHTPKSQRKAPEGTSEPQRMSKQISCQPLQSDAKPVCLEQKQQRRVNVYVTLQANEEKKNESNESRVYPPKD